MRLVTKSSGARRSPENLVHTHEPDNFSEPASSFLLVHFLDENQENGLGK